MESATQKLYSPQQICLASVIGGPLAACWFFARNYRGLGKPGSATKCLVWGSVGTVALFVAAFFVPKGFPHMVIPLGYSIGLREVAKQIHGNTVTEYVAAGGRLGSWWAVAGISFLFLIGIFVVFFGCFLSLTGQT